MYFMRIILFLTLFVNYSLYSQNGIKGVPFVKNFAPSDYKAKNDNWAVIQDDRGIMYFGNKGGILEFDGVNWKNIAPDKTILIMKKDKNGVIYGTGVNEAGYINYNNKGETEYISLLTNENKNNEYLGNFHDLIILDSVVYFTSNWGYILKWKDNKLTKYHLAEKVLYANYINNKIYVVTENGLGIFDGSKINEVNGGKAFSKHNIRLILPNGNDSLLVISRTSGIFVFSNGELTTLPNPSNDFLIKNQVYKATLFNDSLLAFGTVENGVLITNKKGVPIQHINRSGGLQNNDHCAIYADNRFNIWSGLESGISCTYYHSPFTQINEQWDLPSAAIYNMLIYGDYFYASTAQGVYYIKWKNNLNSVEHKYNLIKETEGRKAWVMNVYNNDFICSSSNVGTFVINNFKGTKISNYIAKELILYKNKYLIGPLENAGFAVFEKKNNQWKLKKQFVELPNLFNPIEDKNGNIWANENDQKVICLKFDEYCDTIIKIVRFDSISGLTSFKKLSLFIFNNQLRLGTANGTYKLENNTFVPCNEFNASLGNNFHILHVKTDNLNNTWFLGIKNGVEILGKIISSSNGKIQFEIHDFPLLRLTDLQLSSFYPVNNTNVFFGTSEKIIHYNPTQKDLCKDTFAVLIRSVEIIQPTDSLLFGGTFLYKGKVVNTQPKEEIPIIAFKNNALRFKFSAMFYEGNEKNLYQFTLEGFDKEWSEWTNRAEKEYTNLLEGRYCFKVRAKNVFGTTSSVASYSFVITAPWYRTIFAYILYLLAFIFVIFLSVKISIHRIEKEKIKLEKIVAERTAEVVAQKEEIVYQNQILIQNKEEILTQNEILNQQKEEITSQNEALNLQNEEIQAQRDNLEMQNIKISDQNKVITSSIRYASTIQMALLTSKKTIDQVFPENFIFYKPRDIVSGDFYWVKKINDISIIVVADCTGHGVPGAFMSMLGIAYLNEIVSKREVTQANHVLNEMRKQIRSSLCQTDSDNDARDGMDMAIVVIYEKENILEYAGALIPLYLFRKNENNEVSLIEFKADSLSIGNMIRENETYTNQRIEIKKGDSIYLHSDGYTDQFHKETNQKFSKRRLKELLASIQKYTMSEQKQILESNLKDWAGDNEQIDDILVAGFRIGK